MKTFIPYPIGTNLSLTNFPPLKGSRLNPTTNLFPIPIHKGFLQEHFLEAKYPKKNLQEPKKNHTLPQESVRTV